VAFVARFSATRADRAWTLALRHDRHTPQACVASMRSALERAACVLVDPAQTRRHSLAVGCPGGSDSPKCRAPALANRGTFNTKKHNRPPSIKRPRTSRLAGNVIPIAMRCSAPTPPLSGLLNADSAQLHCPPVHVPVQPWYKRVFVIRIAADEYPVTQNVRHDSLHEGTRSNSTRRAIFRLSCRERTTRAADQNEDRLAGALNQ
jgi:hypothetical protein